MATVSKFANAHTVVTTGYTNPTNAFADDGVYATAAPAKNASIVSDYGFPAFTTADIPTGSTINSVTAEIQFKESTTASVGTQELQLKNGGTLLGSQQANATEPAVDTLLTHQVLTGISLTDLQTAGIVLAQVSAVRGNSNTAVTFSLDYVKLTVDFTAPSGTAYTEAATVGSTSSVSSVELPAHSDGDTVVGVTALSSLEDYSHTESAVVGSVTSLAPANLVTNSDFEVDLTGWSTGAAFSIARSTTQANTGVASLKAIASAQVAGSSSIGWRAAAYPLSLIPGQAYEIDVYVYIPSTAWLGAPIMVQLWDFTINTTPIATVNADMTKLDQWQKVTITGIANGSVSQGIRIGVDVSTIGMNTADNFFIDTASLAPLLEVASLTDAATIGSVSSVTSADVLLSDSATVSSVTTPSGTELAVYVDQATRTNLVPNGGFEVDLTGWTNTGAATWTRDTSHPTILGSASVRSDYNVTGARQSLSTVDIPVTPGKLYTITIYYEITNFVGASSNGTVLVLRGGPGQRGLGIGGIGSLGGITSGQVRLSNTFAVGTATSIFIELHAINGTAYFDGIQLEEGSIVTQYIDTNGSVVTVNNVPSVTSVSSVELVAPSDAAVVMGVSSASSLETADYVDSAVVGGVTSTSSSETHLIADLATASTTTSPSVVDVAAFVENATIATSSSVVSIELRITNDASTIASVTVPTEVDIAAFVDSSTIASVSAVSFVEVIPTDANTVSGKTTPTSIETVQYVDSATISTVSSMSSTELHEITDTNTITSKTTPTTIDVAGFVDAATIANKSSLTAIELKELSDAATASSTSSVSTSDITAYVDAAQISSTSTIVAVVAVAPFFVNAVNTPKMATNASSYIINLPSYLAGDRVFIAIADENGAFGTNVTVTIPGWTTVDSGQFGAFDNQHLCFVLTRVMDGTEGTSVTATFGGTDPTANQAIASASCWRHPDGAPSIDGPPVVGTRIGSLSSSAFTTINISTSGALEVVIGFISYQSSAFTPVAGQTERYDNSSSIFGGTVGVELSDKSANTPGSYNIAGSFTAPASYRAIALAIAPPPSTVTDAAQFVDAALINIVTALTSTEINQDIESAEIDGVTSLIEFDVTQFVESAVIASSSSITSAELHELTDSAIIQNNTNLTSDETAQFVDSSEVDSITSLTSVDLRVSGAEDTATASSSTVVTDTETAQYTEFSAIDSDSSLSSTETSDATESNTVSTRSFVISDDTISVVDAATINSFSTISSTDVTFYVDSSTISTLAGLNSAETAQDVDSAFLAVSTSLTSDEVLIHAGGDADTVNSETKASSTDTAQFVDSAFVRSTTTPTSIDVRVYLDAATVAMTTTYTPVGFFEGKDAASVRSISTLDSIDVTFTQDANTIIGQSSAITTDVVTYADTDTTDSFTSVSYVETTGQPSTFVDSSEITTTTSIDTSEGLFIVGAFALVGTVSLRWAASATFGRYLGSYASIRWSAPSYVVGRLTGSSMKRWLAAWKG